MSTLQISGSKYQHLKIAAISSGALLTLGSLTFLQPLSLSDNSYADTATDSASMQMSVTLDPTISIWTTDTSNNTSNSVSIAADPDESITTGTIRTHVSTNNLTGYTLSIQSSSTNAKMTHENTDITTTIDPLTGNGTSATAWAGNSSLNNKWGYSISSNDSYLGVPGSSTDATTIDDTDEPNNDNTTDITFATKADLSLPAGTYTDTVVFSAVANAVPTGLATISNMQDATSSLCETSASWDDTSTEYTLKDSRDNESYVIRKLKDGNCWMTSNLRLRGENLASGVSTTLNSNNTDLTTGSTFDLPSSATWTSTSTTYKGLLYSGNTNAKIGSSKTAAVSGTQAQVRGTYYTWCTATADCSSAAAAGSDARPSSICPKGWKLPYSDGSSSNTNQFYQLLNDSAKGYGGNYTNFMTAYNYYYSNGAAYYLAGLWNTNGSVGDSGTYGYWWSSRAHSSNANYAWYMYAGTSSVNPAGSLDRYYGFSVRCVLSGSTG